MYTILALKDAVRRAFDFKGRTSRKAYWGFVFWILPLLMITSGIDTIYTSNVKFPFSVYRVFQITLDLLFGAFFWILLSLLIRRHHDTGRYLINLLNPAGFLMVMVGIPIFIAQFGESQPGINPFGKPHVLGD